MPLNLPLYSQPILVLFPARRPLIMPMRLVNSKNVIVPISPFLQA